MCKSQQAANAKKYSHMMIVCAMPLWERRGFGLHQTEIMDENAMRRALTRISYQIIEKNHGADILLAGVRTRGVPLARRIAGNIHQVRGLCPPVLELDISPLRDDLPRGAAHTDGRFPDLPALEGHTVVLVDDVLYTGRTARAAIEAISRMGRAGRIQLAVMIDRGHRELPIRPDYVGKNLPTARSERVKVCLKETDGTDAVMIIQE